MIIRRILGSLLWLVGLVVLVGQFAKFGIDWKYVEYATIVITLWAGYLMITKQPTTVGYFLWWCCAKAGIGSAC